MRFSFQIKKFLWILNNYRSIQLEKTYLSNHFGSPTTYDTDGILTCNNCDFIKEKKFEKAYIAAQDTKPWPGFTLQWRVYIVCWFANHIKNLEGDYVECGVNTGAYSRAVIDYIDFNSTGKTFYLLDTFDGFPDGQINEEEKKNGISYYEGDHYKNVFEQVLETFKSFNVKVIKGTVPETLSQCKAEKIVYLSIDMNASFPEIACAEYFWDKIVKGGVVILDDYGFPLHIQQKLAFDKFAKERNIEIMSLPTGQGIIIKQ